MLPRPKHCNDVVPIKLSDSLREIYISVDASFGSLAETASHVCLQVWGVGRNAMPKAIGNTLLASRYLAATKVAMRTYWLLHEVRRRMPFNEMLVACRDLLKLWPMAKILIEVKANGQAIIDMIKGEFPRRVVGIIPHESKQARAMAALPVVERGQVFLPDGDPLTNAFVEECSKFPNGTSNDRVDTFTQVVNYCSGNTDVAGFVALSQI